MTRDEWLAERRKGICGTDIAAILGLSPFATALDIWLGKKGLLPEKTETPEMRWGKKLEQAIRERYEEETGFTVIQPGFRVNPYNPLILGTPDGIVPLDGGGGRVLEIKTSRTSQGWGVAGSDDIPQTYLLQVAWYMALCDLDRADVSVLIGGSDFRIYHLARDYAFERYLIETATAWWTRHIVMDVEPGIDGSESAKKWLSIKYPKHHAPAKSATAEINSLLLKLENARKDADDVAWQKIQLENQIKDFIGDAEGVDGAWARATWRMTKGRVDTDWQTIGSRLLPRNDIGELTEEGKKILHENTKESPGYRRFCFIKKQNEEEDDNE